MSSETEKLKLVVAVQNDDSCHLAVEKAVNLILKTKPKHYKLYFLYAVPVNTPSNLPYLDHLDKAFNSEQHSAGVKDLKALISYLDSVTANTVEYELVKLEQDKDTGEIIKEFVQRVNPDFVFVGMHKETGLLKKFVLGSVSKYCVDHLEVPVVVVKPNH